MAIGGFLWYTRVQHYQDYLLKNEVLGVEQQELYKPLGKKFKQNFLIIALIVLIIIQYFFEKNLHYLL